MKLIIGLVLGLVLGLTVTAVALSGSAEYAYGNPTVGGAHGYGPDDTADRNWLALAGGPGWYVVKWNGKKVRGPFRNQEACDAKAADLASEDSSISPWCLYFYN